MRIAMITHKIGHGDGQGRVNYELVHTALEQGHSVTVFAEFCSEDIAKHPRGRFIRSRRRNIPTQMLRNLHFAAKSAAWLKRHRHEFDIVQANGFVTWHPVDVVAVHFVHSAWIANASYPFRWRSLSPYAWYQRSLTTMNGFFERKVFRNARLIIAVSKFTASEVTALGVPSDKVRVVYNGVDVEEFKPGTPDRASFGLPEQVPLALFVGDIRTARKNLDTVLQAMLTATNVHLVVAGDKSKSPYPAMAQSMGLGQRVHFIGKTKRIAELMRSVDLFVFPSRYEAHPLVLMEAMASGLPILVSGSFGAGDYIRAAGEVFEDPNDADLLARLMLELVGSPARHQAMASAAREQALGMQWKQTAEGYLKLYDDLLQGRIGQA